MDDLVMLLIVVGLLLATMGLLRLVEVLMVEEKAK